MQWESDNHPSQRLGGRPLWAPIFFACKPNYAYYMIGTSKGEWDMKTPRKAKLPMKARGPQRMTDKQLKAGGFKIGLWRFDERKNRNSASTNKGD